MLEISVVICAHNPRPHYLKRVLDALRAQTLPYDRWELVLVDNASREPLAQAWDLSWHPNARHVYEEELGLANARQRGMREAHAEALIFVDDDNVLAANYLLEAVQIGQKWPQLGVWGSGDTQPDFEEKPADHLKPYARFLALRNTKTVCWSNVFTCREAMPWGAGLCLRKNVALAYIDYWNKSLVQIPDRCGRALVSGGDVEISHVACSIGLGMGLFPTLSLLHVIPKERVTEDYLVRLREGIAISDALLSFKWLGIPPRNYFSPFGFVSILKNAVLTRGIERRMYLATVRAAMNARRLISASTVKT
jgi:hypothetical protein